MSLHVDVTGSGAPLVMLHGWGMHGGIWGNVVPQLAQRFRVHCVDLPGHGYSRVEKGEGIRDKGNPPGREGRAAGAGWASPFPLPSSLFSLPPSPFSLDAIVDELSRHFDKPVTICGWSLGGQVAMRWAQLFPAQVEKLVLVASTPCFVQRAGWQCALAAEILQEFAHAMSQHYQFTLKRFLTLQLRGSEAERELLADLRIRMFSRGEPDMAALHGGLQILRDTDLRAMLPQMAQAAMVIAGERDMLIPPAAADYLARQLPDARLVSIRGAAHVPFLSHPEIFVEQIMSFLHE